MTCFSGKEKHLFFRSGGAGIDGGSPPAYTPPMSRLRNTRLLHGLFWTALLLAGLAVRLIGIRHGEADRMVYHPDVAKQTVVAYNAYQGKFNIRRFFKDDFRNTLYPYGSAILLGRSARALSRISGNPPLHRRHRYYWALWSRYQSVAYILLGTAVLLGALRRHLGSRVTALAGVLLLFEPIQVQLSHYGMNDVPLLAFLYLSLVAAWSMPGEKKFPIFSLLAGLAAGVAFAVKYQGLLALIFPGVFWLYLLRENGPRRALLSLLAVAAGFLAGSLPLSPLLTRDPGYFFATFPTFMQWQAHIMGEAIPLSVKLRTNLHSLAVISLRQGHVLLWLGGIWAGVAAFRRRKEVRFAAPVCALLLFCGILLAAMLFSRDLDRENDLMPVFALLIVASAFPAAGVLAQAHPPWRRLLLLIPAFGLGIVFISTALLDSLALHRLDTRMRARHWCDAHLPPQAVVLTEMYVLPPTRADLTCFKAKYLSDPLSQQAIHDNLAQILITSSLASRRYADRGSPFYDPAVRKTYQTMLNHSRLLASFRDRPLLYAHPDIAVYEWVPASP